MIRELIYDFFELPYSKQAEIARKLNLPEDADQLFSQALESGKLDDLLDCIEKARKKYNWEPEKKESIKTGYKVVRNKGPYLCSVFSPHILKYSTGRWTKPIHYCGPLTLFKNLKDAENWLSGVHIYKPLEIWECEWVPWNEKLPKEYYGSTIKVWTDHKEWYNYQTTLPPGSKLARFIKLVGVIPPANDLYNIVLYPDNMSIEKIARATHEMNRRYCEILGDTSQVAWEDAPEWQRKSAISGVQSIIDGETNSPEEQHQNWMKIKIEEGWTYGSVKDVEKKTHPCLLPYAELPESQKAKDRIFRAVVKGMAGE